MCIRDRLILLFGVKPVTAIGTDIFYAAVTKTVGGLTPKRRISSGVIRVPPPMPVMPTIAPIPKPKMMIAGSMVGRANWLSTFLTF